MTSANSFSTSFDPTKFFTKVYLKKIDWILPGSPVKGTFGKRLGIKVRTVRFQGITTN